MNDVKALIMAGIGAIGSGIAEIFGGWGNDMVTLLIFMGIDFLTGILIAGFWQKSNKSESGALSSNSAFKGLIKKGVILLVVLIGHRLDMLIGTDYIRTAIIIAFCTNELLSIIENLGIMGVPLPSILKKAIELLQEKSEEDKKE